MAATFPPTPTPTYVDPPVPRSLLLYPSLVDQTTLSDLVVELRNCSYHEHRNFVTRVHLNRLLLANALIARLASVLYYVQTLLVRFIVNNTAASTDLNDFAGITEAAHVLQKEIISKCATWLDEDVYSLSTSRYQLSSPTLFFNDLSPTASSTLLKFLTSLRTDSNFLSSRLLKASDAEYDALLRCTPYQAPPASKADINAPNADSILSFRRHDPLYILTSVIFPSPCDPNSAESHRRLQCWSSCLAQLLDAKRGHQVVFSVLDIWWGLHWQVAAPFETALLGFLQSAERLKTSRSVQLMPDDDEAVLADPAMVDMLDKTVAEILAIVSSVEGLPPAIVQLLQAVCEKSCEKQDAKTALFTEWFVRHFMLRAIHRPEVCIFRAELTIVSWTTYGVLY
jgi:hypothetical protein